MFLLSCAKTDCMEIRRQNILSGNVSRACRFLLVFLSVLGQLWLGLRCCLEASDAIGALNTLGVF